MELLEVSVVVSELQKAVQRSHNSHTEAFTRAAVALCLQRGLTVTGTGYMMDPVLLPEMDHVFLQSRSCQNYFSIVTGPPSCEPMVVAHIPALISKPHKLPVRHILSRLQINTLYPTKSKDALRQITDSSAASSSANSNFPYTKASRSRSDGSNTQVAVKMVKTAVQAKQVNIIGMQVGTVAVDCEGCCLSCTGKLCLVQVLAGETCYVFDMLLQDLDIVKELKSLMENSSVVKVIHDCRQDSAALFYQLQIRLDNVFDTQVAHGLAAFWDGMLDGQQQNQHRCGLTKLLAIHGLQPHTTKEGRSSCKADRNDALKEL